MLVLSANVIINILLIVIFINRVNIILIVILIPYYILFIIIITFAFYFNSNFYYFL